MVTVSRFWLPVLIPVPSRDATDELRTLDLKQKDLKGIKMSISLWAEWQTKPKVLCWWGYTGFKIPYNPDKSLRLWLLNNQSLYQGHFLIILWDILHISYTISNVLLTKYTYLQMLWWCFASLPYALKSTLSKEPEAL